MNYDVALIDFKLKDNKMIWKLNNIPFDINYNFNIDTKFKDVFKLIPVIQTCCLVTSYKGKVNLVSDIGITEEMYKFMSKYMNIQYVFNMEQLEIKIKKEHPSVNITFTNINKSNTDVNFNDGKNIVSSWSGGKDSLLTIKLLQECGYNVVPTTTKWNTIAFNRGAHPFLKNHEIKENIIASIALGNKMKKLFKYALAEQGISVEETKSGTFQTKRELPMILYHSFYMNVQNINNIIYALHHGIKHVFTGDEADVNYTSKYYGFKRYNNVGQGYKNKTLLNEFLTSTYGKNSTQIHSLLYPIYGPLEVKMLLERYNTVDFSSCLTMIGGKYSEKCCCICPKCLTSYLTCKTLGYDPIVLGINETKLLKYFNDGVPYSYLFPDDKTLYWFVKNCIHDTNLYPIVSDLVSETPEDLNFNPLKTLKNKYNTVPEFIRKKITKIYDEYN